MNAKPKNSFFVLLLVAAFSVSFFMYNPLVANATLSGALIINGYQPTQSSINSSSAINNNCGSGIALRDNDSVKITNQVVDVVVSGDVATFTSTYTIKNSSFNQQNTEGMFLTKQSLNESSVKRTVKSSGGETLSTMPTFFVTNNVSASMLADWENVVDKSKVKSLPYGDGSGFFEYNFGNTDSYQSQYGIEITTEKLAFYYENGNRKIVSKGNVSIKTCPPNNYELPFVKKEIENVYDYIFEKGCEGVSEADRIFAKEQFFQHLYFSSGSTFRYTNVNDYLSANIFNLTIEPNESIELFEEYSTNVYSLKDDGLAWLYYYLSPTKNWSSNASFSINLTLNVNRPYLFLPQAELIEIYKGKYTLTQSPVELVYIDITMSARKPYEWDWLPLIWIIGGFAVLQIVGWIVFSYKKKNKHNVSR